MPRLIIACVACVLFALPAQAQEPGTELLAGYRLGKFQVTSSMLAHELTMLVALVEETGIVNVTDENYAAGLVNDEDITTANMALAYGIWRCQFLILPVCDGGLSSDSFQHPVMVDFKEPTMEILAELKVLSEDFVEDADYAKLAAFTAAIVAGDYIDDLLLLSDQAAVAAGEAE